MSTTGTADPDPAQPPRAGSTAPDAGTAPEAGTESGFPGSILRLLPRVALVLLVTASLTITLAGLRATAGLIGPTFLALVLTITVHPARRTLVRRGWPEWLVSVVVVLAVYAMLLSVTLALVVSMGQLASLVPQYEDVFAGYVESFADWLGGLGVSAEQLSRMTESLDGSQIVGLAGDVFGAVLAVASNLFFVITLALFMAFDTGGTQRGGERLRASRPHLIEAMGSFARGTRTYMAVAATFGLIVAVIDGLALQLLGVPGAFIWAVLAFVTNFIPNIGFVIGVIPPAIIGLLEGGPSLMLAVLAVYSVINVVIQSIIQPRYVGDAVRLSPTITLISLAFWAWLLGPLGALMAVPLSLLMRAILVEADPSARWSLSLLSGHPEEPETHQPAPA
ncbi:MAG TPA: AI-2E family transporter [Ornithinibacter sp.]|nr:AI-2E family transporter [Ornithinibacter sp.]